MPGSELRMYYPDNPRGYFEEEPQPSFTLQVLNGSQATLEYSAGTPASVRVAIERAIPDVNWNVQLNVPGLRVERAEYVLTFRARADRPRTIWAGFALAHSSGANLGLYQELPVSEQWQSYREVFTTTAGEENARVHFDLASAPVSVEFSDVLLQRASDGTEIEADRPPRYRVRYSFNRLGCRGRDYEVPRPEDVVRILALGDSYTMGIGVHVEDTFAAKMEHLAAQPGRAAATRRLEAINCGVSGWATRQARLFYELHGVDYQPQIVLLTMVWNDDMSWLDEFHRGYVRPSRTRAESLFRGLELMRDYRREHRRRDYSDCVQNLRQLAEAVHRNDGRLVVVIFQNGDRKEWSRLIDAVAEGLRGTDVPLLNLAAALSVYPRDEMIVHPADHHPNEKAHDVAAREILQFLQRHAFVGW